MIGTEAGIHATQRDEGADHQPGADEQDERERHLRGHEQAAQPVPSGPRRRPALALAQAPIEVGRGGLQRGSESEEKPGANGKEERESEHSGVHVDGGRARETRRQQRDQHPYPFDGDGCAEAAADDAAELADRIARGLGVAADDPARTRAALLHALSQAEQNGSTCLPREQLVHEAGRLLDPDFREFGAFGRVWDRESILDAMAAEDAPRSEADGVAADRVTGDTILGRGTTVMFFSR